MLESIFFNSEGSLTNVEMDDKVKVVTSEHTGPGNDSVQHTVHLHGIVEKAHLYQGKFVCVAWCFYFQG